MAQSRHGKKHKKRANKYKNELLAEKKRKKDEYVRAYMEKIKEMQAAQEQNMKRQENGQIVDGSDIGVDIDVDGNLEIDLGDLDDEPQMSPDGFYDTEPTEPTEPSK